MVAAIPGHVAGAVTFDDSSDSRSALTEISAYCKSVDLPLSVISRPGDLESIVREQSPQYVLVSGWYWIIKPALLSSVPGGFVGLHPSLLPKYRGSAPLVWALLNGEKQTGVSLFYFDDGMDTGDIIDQRSFAIEPEDSIAELLAKAESANLDLVKTYAGSLLSNTAPRRRQDHKLASYGSPRRPEDGRICWNQSATEVHNFIRAQTRPYPCAFTHSADGR